MRTLDETLKNEIAAFCFGNRILLPFKAEILKAVIEKNIITDFSTTHKGAQYSITDSYTEIYFLDYEELTESLSKYETIKLIIVETGKDLFDLKNHRKLVLHLKENHQVLIEENNEILFIE